MPSAAHRFPRIFPRYPGAGARLDGRELDVLHVRSHPLALCEVDGPARVEITLPEAPDPATFAIRPLRLGLHAEIDGCTVRFDLPVPARLCLTDNYKAKFFLFAHDAAYDPAAHAPGPVRRFAAGQIHEVGELVLEAGETVILERGAVVRGCILASRADHVAIRGPGVLDGDYFQRPEARRSIHLDHCRHALVEGITMIRPTTWMCVLGACEDVTVRGLGQLGEGGGSDGIDIVGSRRVLIEDCFLRNGDDNIVLKAIAWEARPGSPVARWRQRFGDQFGVCDGEVCDIEARRCSIYNDMGGSATEIGYETRTDHIRRIVFRDLDILAVHGFQSVFGIHNGDRATVSDVLWEDIRVEHHYDKLIDFRVLHSRWNRDPVRGHVRGVTIRRAAIHHSIYNPGYTTSVIAGYGPGHLVEDVTLEQLTVNGTPVTDDHQIDLLTRDVRNLVLR